MENSPSQGDPARPESLGATPLSHCSGKRPGLGRPGQSGGVRRGQRSGPRRASGQLGQLRTSKAQLAKRQRPLGKPSDPRQGNDARSDFDETTGALQKQGHQGPPRRNGGPEPPGPRSLPCLDGDGRRKTKPGQSRSPAHHNPAAVANRSMPLTPATQAHGAQPQRGLSTPCTTHRTRHPHTTRSGPGMRCDKYGQELTLPGPPAHTTQERNAPEAHEASAAGPAPHAQGTNRGARWQDLPAYRADGSATGPSRAERP